MGKAEARLRTPLDDQRAEVDGCMVDSTESCQGIWCMPAPVGTGHDMVHVKKHVILTTWHGAALVVAPQDLAPRCAWHGLRRALVATVLPCVPHAGAFVCVEGVAVLVRVPHVGAFVSIAGATPFALPHVGVTRRIDRSDRLAVAIDHAGKRLVRLNALAASIDAHPGAVRAARHCHLVARTALVSRAAKDLPGELVEKRVVVELVPDHGLELRLKVAKERQGFGAHFEAKHVLHELGPRPIGWHRTWWAQPNGVLDIAAALALCPAQPWHFGLRSRYSRELPNSRPGHRSRGKGFIESGQRRERARNPQPLLKLLRAQA